jgi:transposase-like protein
MDLTMTKHTNEKKEHALSQMSAPHNKPVAAVAQLTGVPEATLHLWRKQARETAPSGALGRDYAGLGTEQGSLAESGTETARRIKKSSVT